MLRYLHGGGDLFSCCSHYPPPEGIPPLFDWKTSDVGDYPDSVLVCKIRSFLFSTFWKESPSRAYTNLREEFVTLLEDIIKGNLVLQVNEEFKDDVRIEQEEDAYHTEEIKESEHKLVDDQNRVLTTELRQLRSKVDGLMEESSKLDDEIKSYHSHYTQESLNIYINHLREHKEKELIEKYGTNYKTLQKTVFDKKESVENLKQELRELTEQLYRRSQQRSSNDDANNNLSFGAI